MNWVQELLRYRLYHVLGERSMHLLGNFTEISERGLECDSDYRTGHTSKSGHGVNGESTDLFVDLTSKAATAFQEPISPNFNKIDTTTSSQTPELDGEQQQVVQIALDHLREFTESLMKPNAAASNNWVLSGRHTQSGYPILANDPHLRLQIPSIWYLAELNSHYHSNHTLAEEDKAKRAKAVEPYVPASTDLVPASEEEEQEGDDGYVRHEQQDEESVEENIVELEREIGVSENDIAKMSNRNKKPAAAATDKSGTASSAPIIKKRKLHVSGATLPGSPWVMIGHNERVAWGATAMLTDCQDLYLLKINPTNPNQYLLDGKWTDMIVREEWIQVKGQKQPVRYTARATVHGPVITDAIQGISLLSRSSFSPTALPPMSLRWTGSTNTDETHLAFGEFAYAKNYKEFRGILNKHWTNPPLNLAVSDIDKNIAMLSVSLVPVRAPHHKGSAPVPGWRSDLIWKKTLSIEESSPVVVNPLEGFLASANEQCNAATKPYHFTVDYALPYRANRAKQILRSFETSDAGNVTVSDMIKLQCDTFSQRAADILPFVIETIRTVQKLPSVIRQNMLPGEVEKTEEDKINKQPNKPEPTEIVPRAASDIAVQTSLDIPESNNVFSRLHVSIDKDEAASQQRLELAGYALSSKQLEALDKLAQWDYFLDADSAPASMYEIFYRHLLLSVLADELHGDRDLISGVIGSDPFAAEMNHLMYDIVHRAYEQVITGAADLVGDAAAGSNARGDLTVPLHHHPLEVIDSWCEDVTQPGRQFCWEIVTTAMTSTLRYLATHFKSEDSDQWEWGRLHLTQLVHPLSGAPYHIGKVFHRTAYSGGDAHSLNAHSLEAFNADIFRMNAIHGPSLRMVVDLGDLAKSLIKPSHVAGAYLQIDSGQSGNVASPHYTDQREHFRPDLGSRLASVRQSVFSRVPVIMKDDQVLTLKRVEPKSP